LLYGGSELTNWRLVFNAATYGARLASDTFTQIYHHGITLADLSFSVSGLVISNNVSRSCRANACDWN
jgi:hypothetical protein